MRKRLLALWMAVLMVVSFMPTSYAQVTLPDAAPSAEKTEAAASPAPTPTPVAPEGTKAPGAAATPAPTQSAAQDETETENAVAPQAASYTATFRLAPVITSNFPDQLNLKVNSAFQVGRKQVLSDISTEHEVTEVRADGTVVITFHFYSKEDSQWINTINLPRWDRVWELYGATGNKPGANIRISSSASGGVDYQITRNFAVTGQLTYNAGTTDAVSGLPAAKTVGLDEGGEYSTLQSSFDVQLTEEPTRDGYLFCGWATSEGGSVAYRTGDTVTLYGTDEGKDVPLYAVWVKDDSNAYITFTPKLKNTIATDLTLSTKAHIGDAVRVQTLEGTGYDGIVTAVDGDNVQVGVHITETITPWELSYSDYDRLWTSNADAKETESATPVSPNGSGTVVVAYYRQFKLDLDKNCPENIGANLDYSYIAVEDKAEHSFMLPSPKRAGYELLGWSTDPNAAEPEYLGGAIVTLNGASPETAHKTLYAVWEQTEFSILLKIDPAGRPVNGPKVKAGDRVGGIRVTEVSGNRITLGFGSSDVDASLRYTLPEASELWNTAATEKSHQQDSLPSRNKGTPIMLKRNGATTIRMTLQEDITLTYDANGGSLPPEAQTNAGVTTEKTSFRVSTGEPNRPNGNGGYQLLGWSTDKNAAQPQVQGGETLEVTGSTTLYAVWQAPEDVTVTFRPTGAGKVQAKVAAGDRLAGGTVKSVSDTGVIVVTYAVRNENGKPQPISFNLPEANALWTDAEIAGGSGITLSNSASPAAPGDAVTLHKGESLTASYKLKGTCVLNFDPNGGSFYGSTTGRIESDAQDADGNIIAAITLNDPVRAGFAFLGWSETKDGSDGKLYRKGETFTFADAEATLYAVWGQHNATVKLVPVNRTGWKLTPALDLYAGNDIQLSVRGGRINGRVQSVAADGTATISLYVQPGSSIALANPRSYTSYWNLDSRDDPKYRKIRLTNAAGGVSEDYCTLAPGETATIEFLMDNAYTLMMDANGGEFAPNYTTMGWPVMDYMVKFDKVEVPLPTSEPYRIGYEFQYWSETADDSSAVHYEKYSAYTLPQHDNTLYAIWGEYNTTVKLVPVNLTGRELTVKVQPGEWVWLADDVYGQVNAVDGTTVTLKFMRSEEAVINAPVYTEIWEDIGAKSAVRIRIGGTETNAATIRAGSTTTIEYLLADPYELTLHTDTNGAQDQTLRQDPDFDGNAIFQLPDEAPVRGEDEFRYWAANENGIGAAYPLGGVYETTEKKSDLYAVWRTFDTRLVISPDDCTDNKIQSNRLKAGDVLDVAGAHKAIVLSVDSSTHAYTIGLMLDESAKQLDLFGIERVLWGVSTDVVQYSVNGGELSDNPSVRIQPEQENRITVRLSQERMLRYNRGGAPEESFPYGLFQKKDAGDQAADFTVLPAPDWKDHYFRYWQGSDGKTYQPGDTVSVKEDKTLTAVWYNAQLTLNPVNLTGNEITDRLRAGDTVSIDGVNAEVISVENHVYTLRTTMETEQRIELKADTFWRVDHEIEQTRLNGFGDFTDNDQLIAVGRGARSVEFRLSNYKVLNYNLGADDAVFGEALTVRMDTGDQPAEFTIHTAKPTRDGYKLTCWKDSLGSEYRPGDKITVQGEETLTAVWEIDYNTTLILKPTGYPVNHAMYKAGGFIDDPNQHMLVKAVDEDGTITVVFPCTGENATANWLLLQPSTLWNVNGGGSVTAEFETDLTVENGVLTGIPGGSTTTVVYRLGRKVKLNYLQVDPAYADAHNTAVRAESAELQYTLPAEKPTRAHFDFVGWSIEGAPAPYALEDELHQPGDTVTLSATALEPTYNITAVWAPAMETFLTLKPDANEGFTAVPKVKAGDTVMLAGMEAKVTAVNGNEITVGLALGDAESVTGAFPYWDSLWTIDATDNDVITWNGAAFAFDEEQTVKRESSGEALYHFRRQFRLLYDANGVQNVTDMPDLDLAFTDGLKGSIAVSSKAPKAPSSAKVKFLGWNTDPNASAARYQPGEIIEVAQEITTLYAIWDETDGIRIVISPKADGTQPKAVKVKAGDRVNGFRVIAVDGLNVTFNVPADRKNTSGLETFKMPKAADLWETEARVKTILFGGAKEMKEEGEIWISAMTEKVGAEYDLERTARLIYDANGGQNAPETETKLVKDENNPAQSFTISGKEPTCAGYEFLGWAAYADSTKADFHAGDELEVTGEDTLYAVWQATGSTVYPDYDEKPKPSKEPAQTPDDGRAPKTGETGLPLNVLCLFFIAVFAAALLALRKQRA